MLSLLSSLALNLSLHLSLSCAAISDRPYGTFEQPAARARPRFRYWLPDASVDARNVRADIQSAGALGIGGVEFLPFYNYGGGTPVDDWVKYGFGTPAFNALFETALEAHRENELLMDFAMGPNQGQGVPAETDNPGLQWDLVTYSVNQSQGGDFNQTIPGWGSGRLVAVVSALVLSENAVSIPPRAGQGPPYNYTTLVLQHDSLTDLTDSVSPSTGALAVKLPTTTDANQYRIFAFYEAQTHAKNLDPQSNATGSIFDNGCYIVDHFDARGAQVVTDFWDQYILSDHIKGLLSAVGNSGWEDSMELLSNVSWSPSIPARFQKKLGYDMKRYLPLIIWGNNNINIQSAAPGTIRCVLDTKDGGQGYINDYRIALRDGYEEYLGVFTNWTRSYLGLQYSSQVSYNLPMDMEASIPLDDVPECESLQFRDDVDSYRQFSGSAYLADKRTVSIELGAVFGNAFTYTIPHLLWAANRATSGGVNQYVIHGQQYSGNYSATTWPGYVSFGYQVSEHYSNKQPDWLHGLEASLRYMGRIMWSQQQGNPRIDVAFYNQQSATDPVVHTLYQSTDLSDGGWTYAYLSPTNFELPQADILNGVLGPNGPSFRAMILESSQNVTLDEVNVLINYADSGLPIILSGGLPGYYSRGNASDEVEVKDRIVQLAARPHVHGVAAGHAADQLRTLGIYPRVSIDTNGTWWPTWREDATTGIDYAYVFCDTNTSSGSITVSSDKTPFLLDAWTGKATPLAVYERNANGTTIPLTLAGNDTVILAFAQGLPSYPHRSPSAHFTKVPLGISDIVPTSSGDWDVHISSLASSGVATLSDNSSVTINASNIPPPTELRSWDLTAEHWVAPSNFNDSTIVADKFNTTHELGQLVSWLEIPSLANTSGLGYYSTNFTWPPELTSGDPQLGAYIYFSKVLHAITVFVNGQRLPPLNYNNAQADISTYLQTGSNKILAIVPTTMWNYLQVILPRIENAGAPVTFSGGPYGSPSSPSDNGLVGTASVVPYRNLHVASTLSK